MSFYGRILSEFKTARVLSLTMHKLSKKKQFKIYNLMRFTNADYPFPQHTIVDSVIMSAPTPSDS